MPYDAGNPVRVRATFTDTVTNALVDPLTVTVQVFSPDGVTTLTPTASRDSQGVWEATFTPTIGGAWVAVFTGSGPTCVAQRRIPVNPVPMR